MSKITRVLNQTPTVHTQYGFRWGDVLVERICSNPKSPKFQVLRIHALNGDCIEITIRPRSNHVETFPNPELKKK
jgi:hypothetical protein